MATTLQIRRGNTDDNNRFKGASGEITLDTQLWQLRAHDNLTVGGHVISGSSSNTPAVTIPTISLTNTTGLTYTKSIQGNDIVYTVGGVLSTAYGGTGSTSPLMTSTSPLAITGTWPNVNIALSGNVSTDHGGTGLTTTPGQNQILLGDGSKYNLTTLIPGSGITFDQTQTGILTIRGGGGGTVNLVDFMNARYGANGWSYRTGVGVGTDAGPAINDALQYIRTNFSRGTLLIPPTGIFLINTPINATLLAGNNILGYGSQASKVVYNVNNSTAFNFTGAGGFTGGGIKGLGIFLEAGIGTNFATRKSYSTTNAINLQGDTSFQPDQMVFSDLYVSAISAAGYDTSYWNNGLQIYGVRVSPQGIRVGQWDNIQLFNNYNAGIYIYNGVQHSFNNIGIYTGENNGNNCYITGGGAANTNSTQINMQNLTVSGELNLTNSTRVTINGGCGSLVAGTGFDYYDVYVTCSGSVNTSGIGANGRISTGVTVATPAWHLTYSIPILNGFANTPITITGTGQSFLVKFNNQITKQNVNYDPATGRVTVTVPGIYHLYAQVQYVYINATYYGLSIVKNGATISEGYSQSAHAYGSAEGETATVYCSITMSLATTDEVHVAYNYNATGLDQPPTIVSAIQSSYPNRNYFGGYRVG
jgi:C1q domain